MKINVLSICLYIFNKSIQVEQLYNSQYSLILNIIKILNNK